MKIYSFYFLFFWGMKRLCYLNGLTKGMKIYASEHLCQPLDTPEEYPYFQSVLG